MSFKRSRSTSSPPPYSEPQKAARPSDSPNAPILCTLPPTCNHPNLPTHLTNTRELEAHYATHHAHVCEEHGCACVFPDARLLELHQIECHDPLAAMRKERGEKIFACHLAACPRRFLTPKARRLHLIQAHAYPKEYFFAVTNKGIGGLLRRWGEGASMIRNPWHARDGDGGGESENGSGSTSVDSDEERKVVSEGASAHAETGESTPKAGGRAEPVESLTDALDALALVPSAVRFGRGGKRGGFAHANDHPRGAHGGARGREVEVPQGQTRGMGRGRARGVPLPRGGAIRARGLVGRGRALGVLGGGIGRGMGPGRGVGGVRSGTA
ncbi:hypothetical protein A0H81_06509 [Grifola frondosa]|uniref:C2H2-type domain-containing protein n=1 Tax=Grifola frondosa TaxID=5627 RepID=A0A1C7M9P2_GRIFR|nr:hypothetical protein A0H81_06509 [Grifola frondosa]